jgi:IS605 OrfB family transposase
MKLTLQLKLLPSAQQASALLATMERFNEAASFAARVGFEDGVYSQPSIHARCYQTLRDRFGLSSQMAVRAIGKAVEAFARDKTGCPSFRPHGAMTYDQRLLSFKGIDRVSLLTLDGRLLVPLVFGEYQGERFDRIKGQADLVCRDGQFFLYCTVDLPEPPPHKVQRFLGVDLGIVKIATTSEGESFSGADVERHRRRQTKARQTYQRTNTRNSRRRLRKIARRQARYQRWVNHGISKKLVANAKATGCAIVLEDLRHIRNRVSVPRSQRARLGNWSFGQLRAFVEYKAKLAGVRVVLVDPRNTSRTCSQCGHCDKANRQGQSEFRCLHCGYPANADFNAALNLRALGEFVSLPELATDGTHTVSA